MPSFAACNITEEGVERLLDRDWEEVEVPRKEWKAATMVDLTK